MSRSSNFLPSTGRLLTDSSLSVALDSVLTVSIVGAAVIVIFSSSRETFMLRLRLIVCPTVSSRFSWMTVAKPCFETVRT